MRAWDFRFKVFLVMRAWDLGLRSLVGCVFKISGLRA